jgi:hypothetical protein
MSLRSRSGRYRGVFMMALCCGAILSWQAAAGEPVMDFNLPGCASFRADSNLVVVPVNVFDSRNRVVNHLDPKYFRVFEDGVEQPIAAIGEDDTPASIGFVFDTSASMVAKLDLSRQAVAEFLKFANPLDEFFLLPFDSKPGALTGFTRNAQDIGDQLSRLKPGGATALLDAIQGAFLNIRKGHNSRRAIIYYFRRRRQSQPCDEIGHPAHGARSRCAGVCAGDV